MTPDGPSSYRDFVTDSGDPFVRLRRRDLAAIGECLAAAGRLFGEWEFAASMAGTSRADVLAVLERWPDRTCPARQDKVVVQTLGYLVSYPRRESADWAGAVSISPSQIAEALDRWRGETDQDHGSSTTNQLI